MVQEYLNDNEKELLTVLGRNPEMSLKELVDSITYKWKSSVVRKINQFRENKMLSGPVHYVDYGKLCKNPLYRLFCIIELRKNYKTVIEYLKLIEPLIWVYPVLSSHKELLSAGFLSSNKAEVDNLLQVLKENNIIADYIIRSRSHMDMQEPPNFFGDSVPLLDNLLDPCECSVTSFGEYNTKWNECDIATLSYLHGGYQNIKLIEILTNERKLHHREWTYDQIKYSYEKMLKNNLIYKIYYVNPYPVDKCADFFLFLETDDIQLTQTILCNFAKGARLYKEYTFYDNWGLIGCISHPAFLIGLMHKLDQIEEITKKELYQLRSFPPGIAYVGEYSEFTYYDVEEQTLEYPYGLFKEKIKEKLECE
ncbi:MAG: hypothetical protein PVF58_03095 [Candidatus Methanofastidiosia archaeon]|jgi:hypothetical protein